MEKLISNKLDLRSRITLAFTAICAVVIIGMSFILYDFRAVYSMSNDLVNNHQPVTKNLRDLVHSLDEARYELQIYLLSDDSSHIENFKTNIDSAHRLINKLESRGGDRIDGARPDDLQSIKVTLHEIEAYADSMSEVGEKYETNYTIIAEAASELNPLATEYLGIINMMIDELKADDIRTNNTALLTALSDIRHSWTQMMSYLRIALATRSKSDLVNVNTYREQNKLLLDKLLVSNPVVGFTETSTLMDIHQRYTKNLENVTQKFDRDVWRLDVFIMTQHIVPAFNKLDSIIQRIEKLQSSRYYSLNNQLDSRLDNTAGVYFVVVIITLVLSISLALALTRHIKQRLSRLETATTRISQGDLTTRVEADIEDEIGKFSVCFNDMLENINSYQDELRTARDSAEAANSAKSRFLSRMSHELRTPLNAIIGFSELSKHDLDTMDFTGKDEIIENIDHVHASGQHLLNLVNEVLDLSRISDDEIDINPQVINIQPVLRECIETIKPMLKKKRLSLSSSLSDAGRVKLKIDPQRLKQVMLNLLSNAVKYNRDSGDIHVSCHLKPDGKLNISVNDSGYGIAIEDQHKVFEAFNRLDADARAIDGVGIGLTISKNFVSLMHGSIGVESEPGHGSTFWVEFPAIIISDIAEPPVYSNELDKRKQTILYVEDDISNQLLIRKLFEQHRPELQLVIASSGNEGILLAKELQPELILMDIDLPDIDGEQVMLSLKKESRFSDTPFIAVSADAMESSIHARLQAGFKSYITKPVSVKELLSASDTMLQEAGAADIKLH